MGVREGCRHGHSGSGVGCEIEARGSVVLVPSALLSPTPVGLNSKESTNVCVKVCKVTIKNHVDVLKRNQVLHGFVNVCSYKLGK